MQTPYKLQRAVAVHPQNCNSAQISWISLDHWKGLMLNVSFLEPRVQIKTLFCWVHVNYILYTFYCWQVVVNRTHHVPIASTYLSVIVFVAIQIAHQPSLLRYNSYCKYLYIKQVHPSAVDWMGRKVESEQDLDIIFGQWTRFDKDNLEWALVKMRAMHRSGFKWNWSAYFI